MQYVFRRFLIYFDSTRGGSSLRRICEFREGNTPGGNALRGLDIGPTMESERCLWEEKNLTRFDYDFRKSNKAFEKKKNGKIEKRVWSKYILNSLYRNFSRISIFCFSKYQIALKKKISKLLREIFKQIIFLNILNAVFFYFIRKKEK